MRWLLLPVLIGAATSTPPPVKATVQSGGLTYTAAPGLVVAQRGGQVVWRRSGPLANPTRVELLATPGALLLIQEQFPVGNVVLSVYQPRSGRPLWTNRLFTRWANPSAGFRGMVRGTAIVSTLHGEPLHGDVRGIDLASGRERWRVGQDLVGFTEREVLAIDLGLGAQPMNSPDRLPLTRLDAATNTPTSLNLQLPTRPGCGPMNYQGSIPDLHFTNRHLYALRQDACGKFIARVDWHGPADQTPLVYTDRRPALQKR